MHLGECSGFVVNNVAMTFEITEEKAEAKLVIFVSRIS